MKTKSSVTLTLSKEELHELIRKTAINAGKAIPLDAKVTLHMLPSGWFGEIILATVTQWEHEEDASPK